MNQEYLYQRRIPELEEPTSLKHHVVIFDAAKQSSDSSRGFIGGGFDEDFFPTENINRLMSEGNANEGQWNFSVIHTGLPGENTKLETELILPVYIASADLTVLVPEAMEGGE